MSILNTTNPTNFMLHIPDNGLTEAMQMNVQVYKPPVIEIPFVDQPSGQFGKSRSMLPGTAFKYKPITLSILVDRDLQTWNEMYTWAKAIVNYPDLQNREFENVSNASMFVHILDNQKTDTVLIHKFVDPFPSLIYPPTYNHTASTDYPMIMSVEFKYNMFHVLDKNGNDIMPRKTIDDARLDMYNMKHDDYHKRDSVMNNGTKPYFKKG